MVPSAAVAMTSGWQAMPLAAGDKGVSIKIPANPMTAGAPPSPFFLSLPVSLTGSSTDFSRGRDQPVSELCCVPRCE